MGIKKMVNRFLCWKLPKDFAPDSGISFKEGAWWPTGTNLLHAGQAEEMFRHCVGEDVVSDMGFGEAIEALKSGKKLARAGWNGKGMFVYYVPANAYPVQTGAAKSHFGEGSLVPYNAYLAIKNVNETVSTWVPSVNDVLAEDWAIVP